MIEDTCAISNSIGSRTTDSGSGTSPSHGTDGDGEVPLCDGTPITLIMEASTTKAAETVDFFIEGTFCDS